MTFAPWLLGALGRKYAGAALVGGMLYYRMQGGANVRRAVRGKKYPCALSVDDHMLHLGVWIPAHATPL